MSHPDVIVVGGGPAGAACAWFLARQGAKVSVLDRARFPRDKPCSEYLSPEASRILDAMGALGRIQEAGAAHLAGMRIRSPNGTVFQGDFVAAHGWRGYSDRGVALPRTVLDACLLDCARDAGASVEEGVRVTDVIRDARGRVCGVQTLGEGGSKRQRNASLVVAADGLRSVIARRMGLAHQARFPRRIALVTHFEGIEEVSGYGEMHVDKAGYTGIAPVGNGLCNVAVVIPAGRAASLAGDRAGFLLRWISERPHLAPRFQHARRTSPVHATGPFASHARRAWAPGVALVGDAADFFDPFTGEGIHAALRGGEMLAPAVLQSLAATSLARADAGLREYDESRVREFSGKWRVERLIGAAVSFPWFMDRAARSLSRRKEMADLLVGVAGDFVPPREVLKVSFFARLLADALIGGTLTASHHSESAPRTGRVPASRTI
ncbi:MAG: NAD(P)/FAD-dependent oxidoreductase [Anaerolineae bacterium]|nr:NAD(P)/FAD-dependent oxidoreductase [Gemmatimonadaceae bacterium]